MKYARDVLAEHDLMEDFTPGHIACQVWPEHQHYYAAERSRYSSSDSSGEEGDQGKGQLLLRVLELDLGAII